jgi:hypothetical protein
VILPVGQPLGKVHLIDAALQKNFSRFQPDLPQARTAAQAGAFVEETVAVDEALGLRLGIVRVGVDHTIGVYWCSALRDLRVNASGRQ